MIETRSFVYFVMKLILSAGLDSLSVHRPEGIVNLWSDYQNCLSDQIVDQQLSMRKGEFNWKSKEFNEKNKKSEKKKGDFMNLQRLTGEIPDAYKAGITILNGEKTSYLMLTILAPEMFYFTPIMSLKAPHCS